MGSKFPDVSNAFRHHGECNFGEAGTDEADAFKCSTPSGITASATRPCLTRCSIVFNVFWPYGEGAAQRVLQGRRDPVLNAFRHHRERDISGGGLKIGDL